MTTPEIQSPQPALQIGDTIVVNVKQPHPGTIRMTLATPESVAYANELIADPTSGWTIEPEAAIPAPEGGPALTDDRIATFLDAYQNDRRQLGDYEAFRGTARDIWDAALAAQPQVHPDGTVNPTPQTPVECSVCGGLVVGVAPAPAEGAQAAPERYSPDGEGGMEIDSLGDWVKFRPTGAPAQSPAEGDALLRMLANRARTFPNYPLGYHIPEVFAALGEEPPKPNVQPKGTACVDPMCACRGGPCAECPEGEREKELADLKSSLDFYKRRCDALQACQSTMRDPERTMACDILANGSLLINGLGKLAAERYAVQAPAPAQGSKVRADALGKLRDALGLPEADETIAMLNASVRIRRLTAEAAQAPAVTAPEKLHTFLNAAAGEGFVLDGVDAADLYVELFPERYAAAVAKIDTGVFDVPVHGQRRRQ